VPEESSRRLVQQQENSVGRAQFWCKEPACHGIQQNVMFETCVARKFVDDDDDDEGNSIQSHRKQGKTDRVRQDRFVVLDFVGQLVFMLFQFIQLRLQLLLHTKFSFTLHQPQRLLFAISIFVT